MYLAQAPHTSAVYREKKEDRPCHYQGSVQEPRYPDSSAMRFTARTCTQYIIN